MISSGCPPVSAGTGGHPRLRAAVAVVLGLLVASGAVFAAPARPAYAHAQLIGTTPANGARLDAAPAEIVLRFSDRVNVVRDGIRVVGAGNAAVPLGQPKIDPAAPVQVRAPLPGLGAGGYTVYWRVVSADSHPIHGVFVFTVGDATALPLPEAGARTDADAALSAVFWLFRWLGYAGLALLAGGAVFLLVCWPAGRTLRRTRRLLAAGWGASVASAAAVLLMQGAYATGGSLPDAADPALLAATLSTEYGRYMLVRLALLALGGLLLLGAVRQVRHRRPVLGVAAAVTLAVALPATWVGTGHANAAAGVLSWLADTAHLAAMAGWLGGLALLLLCVLPDRAQRPVPEVAGALVRFSRLATGAVIVLVVTGTYQAWRGIGSLDALAGTTYGTLLVFKLAAVGTVLWFGAMSRSAVRRRYLLPVVRAAARRPAASVRGQRRAEREAQQQDQAVRRRLRSSVRAEVLIVLGILGLTAMLVATPPASRPAAAVADPAATARPGAADPSAGAGLPSGGPERVRIGAFQERAPIPGGTVDVRLDPAEIGATSLTLVIRRTGGSAWDVPEAGATAELPAREMGPFPVTLVERRPGEYASQGLSLPSPGFWLLRITVRTTEIDQTTIQVEAPVG